MKEISTVVTACGFSAQDLNSKKNRMSDDIRFFVRLLQIVVPKTL